MTTFYAEIIGTALMIILGNGVISNVLLKESKGYNSGWIVIATGWGLAIALPVALFASISGAQFNPAVTLSLATIGELSWSKVPMYIGAQTIGAFLGAFIVWLMYKPYFDKTDDSKEVLSCFSTVPAIRGHAGSFIAEVLGTFVLVFGALGIGAQKFSPGVSAALIGSIVWALVLSLGGPTGCALNPTRDLMPRIAHTILPMKTKGNSDWSYAWIPIIAPIVGGILGAITYTSLF